VEGGEPKFQPLHSIPLHTEAIRYTSRAHPQCPRVNYETRVGRPLAHACIFLLRAAAAPTFKAWFVLLLACNCRRRALQVINGYARATPCNGLQTHLSRHTSATALTIVARPACGLTGVSLCLCVGVRPSVRLSTLAVTEALLCPR